MAGGYIAAIGDLCDLSYFSDALTRRITCGRRTTLVTWSGFFCRAAFND
jgi:hypothetical protein